jgi:hypothetical protein
LIWPPMIARWISEVPSQMRSTRMSLSTWDQETLRAVAVAYRCCASARCALICMLARMTRMQGFSPSERLMTTRTAELVRRDYASPTCRARAISRGDKLRCRCASFCARLRRSENLSFRNERCTRLEYRVPRVRSRTSLSLSSLSCSCSHPQGTEVPPRFVVLGK